MKSENIEVNKITYVFLASFVMTRYLAKFRVNRDLINYLVKVLEDEAGIFFKEKRTKYFDVNIDALKKIGVDIGEDGAFFDVVKRRDLAYLMTFDYEYIYLSDGTVGMMNAFETDHFDLNIRVKRGNDIIFEIKGVAKFEWFIHVSGVSAFSLIFQCRDIPSQLGFEKLVTLIRYLIRSADVDPLEYLTHFAGVLREVAGNDVKLDEIDYEYIIRYKDKVIRLANGENTGDFINSLILIVMEAAERYFSENKKYEKYKKRFVKEFRFISTNDYMHIEVNAESAYDDREIFEFEKRVVSDLINATIYNQSLRDKDFKKFWIEDVRDGINLYYVEPFLIEFSYPKAPIEIPYDELIPDPPLFVMLNVLAILKMIFRGLEAILDEAINQYFEILDTFNELLMIQKTFLTFIEEYRNIRFIGPDPYEILYDRLKEKFKLTKMYESFLSKMNILGTIMQRHHYLSLKQREVTKKKLLLIIQIFALSMTVIGSLDLIIHRWSLVAFTNIFSEIMFYVASIIYVTTMSIYAFVSYYSFVSIRQIMVIPWWRKFGYVVIWSLLIILGLLPAVFAPKILAEVFLATSIVSIIAWFIFHYTVINRYINSIKTEFSKI